MQQQFLVVNADKKEYLNPKLFGDDTRIMGLAGGDSLCMGALSVLLLQGNGRGSGEFDHPAFGAWAGDKIVVTGDMAPFDHNVPADMGDEVTNLHGAALCYFKDISLDLLFVLAHWPALRARIRDALHHHDPAKVPAHLAQKAGLGG